MNNPYSAPDALMTGDNLEDDTYAPKFFSLEGRIGRLRYIGYSWLASVLAIIVFAILAAVALPSGSRSAPNPALIGILYYVPLLAAGFIMTRRRLHDLENSGWLGLLIIIPLVNILFWLYLIFAPGTNGANKYGPKPDKNSGWVWIILVVVPIAIIGILAAVAIPAYSDYTKRAKALHEQQLQQQQAPAPQDQQTQQ